MLIKQAVILCGGLGTRLKPITDYVPKPMAKVNDKPFLEIANETLASIGKSPIDLNGPYLRLQEEERRNASIRTREKEAESIRAFCLNFNK